VSLFNLLQFGPVDCEDRDAARRRAVSVLMKIDEQPSSPHQPQYRVRPATLSNSRSSFRSAADRRGRPRRQAVVRLYQKITLTMDRPQLSPEEIKKLEAVQQNNNSKRLKEWPALTIGEDSTS
jgi:hypothetical protein